MLLYPNCKINLGLRVIRKREDGYHELETIFVPIYGLHDELELSPVSSTLSLGANYAEVIKDQVYLWQEGIEVDCTPEDNLLVKCYRLLKTQYPQIGAAAIRFKKNIPFGAGLGGGSSDAAHMALALNEIFDLGLSKEQLAQLVRSLGADCPFFIYNTPCYAEGIGDVLTPIELDLQGIRIVMLKPNEGVSTKEAYAGIIRHQEVAGQMKSVMEKPGWQKDPQLLGRVCQNDFEQTVFPLHPIIAQLKKRLQDAGAFYAAMSGSGSTVYGLFQDDTEGCTNAHLRLLEQEFASMVLLNDTFGEWKA